jgi:hypothetical protein
VVIAIADGMGFSAFASVVAPFAPKPVLFVIEIIHVGEQDL